MYFELQVRSYYSFLEGASSPAELTETAAGLGLSGLALVDRNGVYGVPKAYHAQRGLTDFKLIVGATLSFADHPDLVVLAQTRQGYSWLCRLLTQAHTQGEKAQPQLNWSDWEVALAAAAAQQVLVLVPTRSWEKTRWSHLRDLCGAQLYSLLTFYEDGSDRYRQEQAAHLKSQFGVSPVASQDVLYHEPSRRRLQDVLMSVQHHKSLDEMGFLLRANGLRYLRSYMEMCRLYKDWPEALRLTRDLGESCQFCLSELRYQYPSEWIPDGQTAQSYLTQEVWQGADRRYQGNVPAAVRTQLIKELALIDQLQFADYFLTIYDIVQFASRQGILCQGRGSAANSAVCYCLGITAVDPVRMNLLFERFISAERNEPPDIDIDFEHERREEVIQYVYQKYGRHRAAMVSAVVTYRKKSAVRDVSRAFGLDVGTASAKEIADTIKEKIQASRKQHKFALIDELSREIQGFPRHLSIHSGGFTLSANPIIDIVPLESGSMPGRSIIQWDKYDLDYLGLLKVDLLSLGMLSALKKCLVSVGKALYELPGEDAATYQMIQKTHTVGVFQIESRAQMSMLGRLLPQNFYDLVIQIAIVRPGPIVGKMVHPYLRRRQGLEAVNYPHPKIRDILGKTLGVPLFQEQVMKLAIELGGFSPGEADELRRAIGAWRSQGSISKMGQKLMNGLIKNGLSEAYAQQVFEQIQGFAMYGFPESHSASFALLAYASAYLKCHYPAQFAQSLLNSQPMGFYAPHTIIDEVQRQGVRVYPIDVQTSDYECQVRGDELYLGLNYVKGLGAQAARNLMAQRPFENLSDFVRRCDLSPEVFQRLAMAGGLNSLGHSPRASLWYWLNQYFKKKSRQLDLFFDANYVGQSPYSEWTELSRIEQLQYDYQAYGLSHRGHPMKELRSALSLSVVNTQQVRAKPPGSWIRLAGLVLVRQRPGTANGMLFATLEDEYGFLDLAISPVVFDSFEEIFLNSAFIQVEGKLQKINEAVSLWVVRIKKLLSGAEAELSCRQTSHPIDDPDYTGESQTPTASDLIAPLPIAVPQYFTRFKMNV